MFAPFWFIVYKPSGRLSIKNPGSYRRMVRGFSLSTLNILIAIIFFLKPLNTSTSFKKKFLTARVIRMAFGANLYSNTFPCRACYKLIAAVASYFCIIIFRMDSRFHHLTILSFRRFWCERQYSMEMGCLQTLSLLTALCHNQPIILTLYGHKLFMVTAFSYVAFVYIHYFICMLYCR